MPSRNWRTIDRSIESLWEIIMTIEISEDERDQLSEQIKMLHKIRARE
jgi:hypothetical protein